MKRKQKRNKIIQKFLLQISNNVNKYNNDKKTSYK